MVHRLSRLPGASPGPLKTAQEPTKPATQNRLPRRKISVPNISLVIFTGTPLAGARWMGKEWLNVVSLRLGRNALSCPCSFCSFCSFCPMTIHNRLDSLDLLSLRRCHRAKNKGTDHDGAENKTLARVSVLPWRMFCFVCRLPQVLQRETDSPARQASDTQTDQASCALMFLF